MRLRNIPGAGEVIDNSPYCIKEPVELKGNWHDFLGNKNPIHIEVGMGRQISDGSGTASSRD